MRIEPRALFRTLGIVFLGVAALWTLFGLVGGSRSFSLAVAGFNVVVGMLLLGLARRAQDG